MQLSLISKNGIYELIQSLHYKRESLSIVFNGISLGRGVGREELRTMSYTGYDLLREELTYLIQVNDWWMMVSAE